MLFSRILGVYKSGDSLAGVWSPCDGNSDFLLAGKFRKKSVAEKLRKKSLAEKLREKSLAGKFRKKSLAVKFRKKSLAGKIS